MSTSESEFPEDLGIYFLLRPDSSGSPEEAFRMLDNNGINVATVRRTMGYEAAERYSEWIQRHL